MSDKHPLEQSVLDDYNTKYEVYINIAYLLHQAKMTESDKDIYELVMKKGAGCKMMIDYLNANNVMGTKKPIENSLFNDKDI